MPLSPEQLGQLHQAQLAGLVRGRWGEVTGDAGSFPRGACLSDGTTGWVLATDAGPRSLGGALVWAAAKELTSLHVLVDANAEVLSREAGHVDRDDHDVTVWRIDGTELVAAAPSAVASVEPPSAEVEVLAHELELAGLDVIVEWGIVRAEVLGLEIARVVAGPGDDDGASSGVRLEAGVGRFDREMSALMHGDEPPLVAVVAAAEEVRRHRYPGAPRHPLRDLCGERWLRHAVMSEPALVGANRLDPVGTTVERTNLRDPWPALALGRIADGGTAMVACTVGVDLDAVVLAADVRAALAPDAQLVVVSTTALPAAVLAAGGWLARPPRHVVVAPPWV